MRDREETRFTRIFPGRQVETISDVVPQIAKAQLVEMSAVLYITDARKVR